MELKFLNEPVYVLEITGLEIGLWCRIVQNQGFEEGEFTHVLLDHTCNNILQLPNNRNKFAFSFKRTRPDFNLGKVNTWSTDFIFYSEDVDDEKIFSLDKFLPLKQSFFSYDEFANGIYEALKQEECKLFIQTNMRRYFGNNIILRKGD